MPRNVTVGLDGWPESPAAVAWAARAAKMPGLPLKLVHFREPVPDPDEVFRLHAAARTRVVLPVPPLDLGAASFQDVPHGRVDTRIAFESPDGR